MKIEFKNPVHPSDKISTSVLDILQAVQLCSIASVGPEHEGHISTAYFCYTKHLDIYFVSDPATKHAQNLARDPRVAVAVFSTDQQWGAPLRGLQFFGQCRLASAIESPKALATHAARFHAYDEYIKALNPLERAKSPYRFYRFCPTSVKVLDESVFGEETFVLAEIIRQ